MIIAETRFRYSTNNSQLAGCQTQIAEKRFRYHA